jgi:hypothetical protein
LKALLQHKSQYDSTEDVKSSLQDLGTKIGLSHGYSSGLYEVIIDFHDSLQLKDNNSNCFEGFSSCAIQLD